MRYYAPIDKKNPRVIGFIKFLENRGVTERGINNILSFAGNRRVNCYLNEVEPSLVNVYDTDDIDLLGYVYKMVRNDEDNIRLHRIYSGAVNRYIEFLTGKRIGRQDKGLVKKRENSGACSAPLFFAFD